MWDIQWVAGESSMQNKEEKDISDISAFDWDMLVSVATDGRVVERSLKRNFE